MLHYILQIIAFQVIFLLVYDLFLKRETFFNYNRLYLLGTAVLSLVLPFIKIESVKAVATKDFIIRLPEVIIGELSPSAEMIMLDDFQNEAVVSQSSIPLISIIFYTGMALATVFFLSKIVKLYWLKSQNPKTWTGKVLIVELLKSSAAFSFFNTIFLGEYIPKTEKPTIIKHELVHVTQKHTLDLLFFEVLRILLWFNPLVYMYQNRIKTLHEYIADAQAIKNNGKRDYYQSLLNQVFETNNLSFINTFFKQSLIKKRIVMLQKSKSKQIALVKYALLIPLVFGMLIYTSANVAAQKKEVEKINVNFEVVEEQDLSEKTLIEKYYKELKGYKAAGEMNKIMKMETPSLNKFRMTLDEYARVIAMTKVMFYDNVTSKVKDGTASKSEKEMFEKFKKTKTYEEYVEETKTDEYARQWENKTEGSTLKLFVKDLKNYTKEEKVRFDEKVALIEKDDYWDRLLVSDGSKSTTIIFGDADGEEEVVEIIEEITVQEVTENIEVPYSVIDNVPVFPECKDLATNDERKDCTSDKIVQFVNKNFNTTLAKTLDLEGRMRISVGFKIGKDGKINSVFARAPHPELEVEAKRVVRLLPKFIPGTQRGKAVTVPYALPILFQVQDDVKTVEQRKSPVEVEDVMVVEVKEDIEVPFSVIENVPTFEECKDLATNDEKKKCTSSAIAKFVNENFNKDLPKALGLEGRIRMSVGFKIDEKGNVKQVFARAPHPKLEEEAKRVIKILPQLIPGTQRGRAVTVPYALPILFQVDDKVKDSTNTPNYDNFVRDLSRLEFANKFAKGIIPFSEVEKVPTFQNCVDLSLSNGQETNEEVKNCTSKTISSFVNKNFNLDLAKQLGLKGRQRIAVFFVFGKDGNLKDLTIKSAHPKLAEEAERVIKLLPKFSPGIDKGKEVDVSYSLPILFQVQ